MDTAQLLLVIREAVCSCVGGADRVAMAYSGGVDSAVIDAVASDMTGVTRYTCGVKGSKDHSEALGHTNDAQRTVLLSLGESDLVGLVREAGLVLNTSDPTTISYTIPILSVLHEAREEVVLTGAGADELFGGYAKYESLQNPHEQMVIDRRKMLAEADALRAHASTLGKRLETPFTDQRVMDLADTIPLDLKVHQGGRKIVLRRLAKDLSIDAHDRPKKAAQYSSGILKEMRRLSRSSGKDLREWVSAVLDGNHGIP